MAKSLVVDSHHLVIKDCDSYPYYSSLAPQSGGNQRLKEDFHSSLEVVRSCQRAYRFTAYVQKQFKKFFNIIESDAVKTLTCNYGVTNSFFAVASDPDLGPHEEQEHGLPPHPSVIFDTNRMAANFPLAMDLRQRQNFVRFYRDRISLEEVTSGTRNPFQSPVKDPMSLVFHEMFHWSGHKHFPKENLDIVYLAQFCCFPQEDHNAQDQALACSLLEDEQAWQSDVQKRVNYLKEKELHQAVRQLISKYH